MSAELIDQYLARIPEPARGTLQRIRAMLRAALPPEATEAMSYGMPAFRYKGPLIAYSASSRHCALYPMSPAVIEALRDELQAYSTSKGTIRFPLDKPLPAALVKKIVKARLAEKELR